MQLSSFFKSRDAGSGAAAVKQAMERIQADIDWLKRNEKIIEAWMEQKLTKM